MESVVSQSTFRIMHNARFLVKFPTRMACHRERRTDAAHTAGTTWITSIGLLSGYRPMAAGVSIPWPSSKEVGGPNHAYFSSSWGPGRHGRWYGSESEASQPPQRGSSRVQLG
jgi:hypothetical protein